MKDREGLDRT